MHWFLRLFIVVCLGSLPSLSGQLEAGGVRLAPDFLSCARIIVMGFGREGIFPETIYSRVSVTDELRELRDMNGAADSVRLRLLEGLEAKKQFFNFQGQLRSINEIIVILFVQGQSAAQVAEAIDRTTEGIFRPSPSSVLEIFETHMRLSQEREWVDHHVVPLADRRRQIRASALVSLSSAQWETLHEVLDEWGARGVFHNLSEVLRSSGDFRLRSLYERMHYRFPKAELLWIALKFLAEDRGLHVELNQVRFADGPSDSLRFLQQEEAAQVIARKLSEGMTWRDIMELPAEELGFSRHALLGLPPYSEGRRFPDQYIFKDPFRAIMGVKQSLPRELRRKLWLAELASTRQPPPEFLQAIASEILEEMETHFVRHNALPTFEDLKKIMGPQLARWLKVKASLVTNGVPKTIQIGDFLVKEAAKRIASDLATSNLDDQSFASHLKYRIDRMKNIAAPHPEDLVFERRHWRMRRVIIEESEYLWRRENRIPSADELSGFGDCTWTKVVGNSILKGYFDGFDEVLDKLIDRIKRDARLDSQARARLIAEAEAKRDRARAISEAMPRGQVKPADQKQD